MISDVDWSVLRHVARREYGMPVGQLLGLLASNWIRKRGRWPLDPSLGCETNEKPLEPTSP